MAKLPDFTELGIKEPRAVGGVAGYQPVTGLENARGKMLERASQEVDSATAFAMKAMDEHDSLRAEDAYNKLQQKKIDLTFGQNGFANLKGGDAVNRPLLKDYGSQLESSAAELSARLDNQNQRNLFTKRAATAQLQLGEDIVKHVSAQSNVYAKEVYEGTLGVETAAATSNWNNPEAVNSSLIRVNAAVDSFAQRNGVAPDLVQSMKLKNASAINTAVISQAIASKDWDYAKAFFEEHKDSIDKTAAAHVEKALYDAGQKQITDGISSLFNSSRDDPKALDALARNVEAHPGLEDTRKNMIIGRIASRIDILNNKAEREQRQRDHDLDRAIAQVNNLTLAGYPPSIDSMTPLVNLAKGTEREGEVRSMIATANLTTRFMSATPQQQEATISGLEAQARKDPTKFDVRIVDRFKTIYAAQKEAVKNDPVTFAIRQGVVDQSDPAAQPLDLSNPAGLNLQARFQLARGMSITRDAPFAPLTSAEVSTLRTALEKTPVAQKSAYFGQLFQASGADYQGYAAIMGQLAKDDPVTAEAGLHAARGHDLPTVGMQVDPGAAKFTSELILQGQSLLHPNRKEDGSPDKGKLWPMPPLQKMEQLFAQYEGNAYAGKPKQRNAEFQTTQAIYAALSSQAGDGTGALDGTRWDQAMKLATGGIETWNGKSTVMPWGMSRGDFKDSLYRRIDDIASSGQLDGTSGMQMRDMPLRAIGDGVYVFTSGDGILVGKNNRPIVVDFNNSAPFRPSGQGGPGFASEAGEYLPRPGIRGLVEDAIKVPPMQSVSGKKVPNPTPSEPTPTGMSGVRG